MENYIDRNQTGFVAGQVQTGCYAKNPFLLNPEGGGSIYREGTDSRVACLFRREGNLLLSRRRSG